MRHCLAVLDKNGGHYELAFFSSRYKKTQAFEDWVKTGKFYREKDEEYTRPYALGRFGHAQFLFNLEQTNGDLPL